VYCYTQGGARDCHTAAERPLPQGEASLRSDHAQGRRQQAGPGHAVARAQRDSISACPSLARPRSGNKTGAPLFEVDITKKKNIFFIFFLYLSIYIYVSRCMYLYRSIYTSIYLHLSISICIYMSIYIHTYTYIIDIYIYGSANKLVLDTLSG